jgi:hypothetical protein
MFEHQGPDDISVTSHDGMRAAEPMGLVRE